MRRARIVIVQGDITDQETEAIVNAANTELVLGAGVAGAIRRKGGAKIQEECAKIGPIPLGEAAVTRGGNLRAAYVIHAASMSWGTVTTEVSLRDSVRNSLLRAEEKGMKSMSFPAIGTGVGGIRPEVCARITLDEAEKHLKSGSALAEVRIVLYDARTYEIFRSEHERRR